jgi:cold shock CspA family protein
MAQQARTGQVKFYNRELGYGFIIPDDRRSEIFFPERDVDRASDLPSRGDRVTYTIGRDRAGRPAAQQVRVIT